jgi:hypothetical protein
MAQDLAQQIENFKSLPQKSLIENFQNFQDLNEILNSLTSPELTQQERVELSFALLKNLFLRDYFLQEYFYVLSLNMSQLTRATPNSAANP